jgi:hypothetical protein
MNFNAKNFRRITDESKPSFKIRASDRATLILITQSGDAEYAWRASEKDLLVARFVAQTDLLLFAWTGQWHTDIFILTEQDLTLYYK